MSVFLYNIIIAPLRFLLEFLFNVLWTLTGSAGISIIGVSLAVNLLCLPLYRRADEMQAESRERQKEIEPWVDHIKKSFRGDERFMMQQALYQISGYSVFSSLGGVSSLLLQIPFFIAAYRFLSELSVLSGTSFWFLTDLSKPDALIKIGAVSINLLPFVMTGFNFISSFIYSKGAPLREKVQLIITALVFLVLLYGCPSGLLFYWTLNNLFSLIKNILFRLFKGKHKKVEDKKVKDVKEEVPEHSRASGYFLAAILAFLISGIMIPLSYLSASPLEFLNLGNFKSPMEILLITAEIYFGIFVFWGIVIFVFINRNARKKAELIYMIISTGMLVTYLFFSKNFGSLSTGLVFSEDVKSSPEASVTNILVLIVLAAVLIFIFIKNRKAASIIMASAVVVAAALSLKDYISYRNTINTYAAEHPLSAARADSYNGKYINLSKNGKNVVVIMADRAIGPYLPLIFDEKPELKDRFSGFTFYPDTVSLGGCTNFGMPELYGGYEYTPEALNDRADETLADKFNEALRVLPQVFYDMDYDVTVIDPPYAGYSLISDLSIYDEYEGMHVYDIGHGRMLSELSEEEKKVVNGLEGDRGWPYIMYSMFRTVPVCLQDFIYNGTEKAGIYMTRGTTLDHDYLNNIAVMENLSGITEIKEEGDCALIMCSGLPHSKQELQKPDYELKAGRHNSAFPLSGVNTEEIYDVNMKTYLCLADWFDYLKREGVYDNTRIIITADHGWRNGDFPENIYMNGYFDAERYMPVMLVKDFDSDGELKIDDSFMTNADTPALALQGFGEVKNPFTGNVISSDRKTERPLMITSCIYWSITDHKGNCFRTDDFDWFTIHDSILDPDCIQNVGPWNADAGEQKP